MRVMYNDNARLQPRLANITQQDDSHKIHTSIWTLE